MHDFWKALLYLHLLAMAFFVGGQLLLAVAVVPAFRRGGNREQRGEDRAPLLAIARRFGWGTVVAVAVLLATGAAMASHDHLWGDGTLQLKLGLVALLGVLIGWHMLRPRLFALDGAIFLVSLVVVWLGLTLAQG